MWKHGRTRDITPLVRNLSARWTGIVNDTPRRLCPRKIVGWDSAAGEATCYGMDGPVIVSQLERGFPNPRRPARGPLSHLYNGYRISFLGVKRQGRGVKHPLPSSAEVKEGVELYLSSFQTFVKRKPIRQIFD